MTKPKTKRQLGRTPTRADKAKSQINASEKEEKEKQEGAQDAKEELDIPPPPPGVKPGFEKKKEEPLDKGDSYCDPIVKGDRFVFSPSADVHKWPAYVCIGAPLALCTYLFVNSPLFLLSGMSFVSLCLLTLIFHLRAHSDYSEFLLDLKPYCSPELPDAIVHWLESLHRRPQFPATRHLRHCIAWFLQPFSAIVHPSLSVVTGVLFHHGSTSFDRSLTDTRLPNLQGVEVKSVRAVYDKWVLYSIRDQVCTVLVSSESVVRQIVGRVRSLSPHDRTVQSEPMASRISNVLIPGHAAPEVARGSAHVAVISCTASDASSSTFAQSLLTATIDFDVMWLLGFLVIVVYYVQDMVASGSTLYFIPFTATTVVLLVPLYEELAKSLLSFMLGISRPFWSIVLGLAELYLNHCFLGLPVAACIPAFVMHCFVGFQPWYKAYLTHAAFNLAVTVLNTYLTGAPQEPAGLPFTPEDFDSTIHMLCSHILYLLKFGSADQGAEFINRMKEEYPWFNPYKHCTQFTPGSSAVVATALVCIGIYQMCPRKGVLRAFRTLYASGYRIKEVNLPGAENHEATITILPDYYKPHPRRSDSCTLGFALQRFVAPFPDFGHPQTALHGVLKRFCKTPPTPNSRKLRALRRFVTRYVQKHYVPIPADADTSVETWLSRTDYPQWRKKQLLDTWMSRPWVEHEDHTNKSFIKREFYTAYKAARGINSRTDTFKCFSGPYFKLMEDQVYHQPCFDGHALVPGLHNPFIKHIPTHLRPQFLTEMFHNCDGPYYETDYSEFEKHFSPDVMKSLELVLYRHMLKHHPGAADVICSCLSGTNKCIYKGFVIKIEARRMSGDMCTSLGNGFSNYMLFQFCAWQKGGIAFGVVEGDDALFFSTVPLTTEDFADLGFDIKIMCHPYLYATAFCGLLSSSDGIILRNPARVVPKFGWSFSPRRLGGPKVQLGLLRARALSLAYESPQCPILHSLAKRALCVTDGATPIFDASYHHSKVSAWIGQFPDEMAAKLAAGPTMTSRVEFAELFDISVPLQLSIEQVFSSWNGEPLDHPLISELFHKSSDMASFAESYVHEDAAFICAVLDSISQ